MAAYTAYTVGQLIKILQMYQMDMPVTFYDDVQGTQHLIGVSQIKDDEDWRPYVELYRDGFFPEEKLWKKNGG